jgi:hypothetical protein
LSHSIALTKEEEEEENILAGAVFFKAKKIHFQ